MLVDIADVGRLLPAVVASVGESTAIAWARDVGPVEFGFENMEWAAATSPRIARRGDPSKGAAQALRRTAG